MKDKNRMSKLLASAIVSAVLGAVMGSLLTILTDRAVKGIPVDPLHIVMFFAVLVTALSFLILLRVETVDEYRYEMMKTVVDGFTGIERESISDFAAGLAKEASYVRVVGTARQDVIGRRDSRAGKKYLECLEGRLSRTFANESGRFNYLRVVPVAVKSVLADHINTCKGNAERTGNVFLSKEVQPFTFYLSYQLFDDTDMLLIVDNESHTGASDNALCLWTRNRSIIAAFIRHFDDAWRKA